MNAAPSPPLAAPELIAQIIYALCQTVTMRLRAASVTPSQLTYVVGRLLGIRKRFQHLVARMRAGWTPRERARRPRPARAKADAEFPLGFRPPPRGWRRWAVRVEGPVPVWRSLRQTFAWLLPLAPAVAGFPDSAASHRAHLMRLLAEPEMAALLRASRRVGDSLRPLCWMLGIEAALLFPATAPSAPVAAPEAPAATSAAARPEPVETALEALPGPASMGPAMVEPAAARPRARDGGDHFAAA